MGLPQRDLIPRPIRVAFPIRMEFHAETILIREFTDNLSTGGIYLLTDDMLPVGTRGRLTFRLTPWDDPFTLTAEVVRAVEPGEEREDEQPGLGIRFIGLTDVDRRKLERLVGGIQDGSVIQAIRRSIREEGKNLETELRKRPTSHKVILALGANAEEVAALIREGNPAAVERLFENPRLAMDHVRRIVRDRRTTTNVMMQLRRKHKRWLADRQVHVLFCGHPNTPIADAQAEMKRLPLDELKRLSRDPALRPQLRMKADQLVKFKGGGSGR